MASTRTPRGPGVARFGPVGDWTQELGEAFLALVEQTGNYRAAARALGHRHLFNSRMWRNPGFRRQCEAAAAAADARLRGAASPFPGRIETKAMPPEGPPETPRPAEPEPVIRRTSNGRTQISHVREGGWTSADEADFLARLRATGNFDASARAVGFNPNSVYRRQEEWPAFARACRDARDAAGVMLEYRLIACAHALLLNPADRDVDDEADEAGPGVPFDPEAAMRIIVFLDRRKAGLTAGRGHGPPERSFEEVAESILGKLRAIERHDRMFGKPKEGEGDEGDEAGGGSG